MKVLSGGKLAVIAKVIILALTLSMLGTLGISAFATGEFVIALFIVAVMILLAVVYLTKISIPMKFFLPGMVFLSAFVVVPIVYTVFMSGFQFQTGNYISKPEAIEKVQSLGVVQDENLSTFDVRLGRDQSSNFELLVSDIENNSYFLAGLDSRTDLAVDQVKLNPDGIAESATNFTPIPSDELSRIDSELNGLRFVYQGDYFLVMEGFDVASVYRQILTFDKATDTFSNLDTGVQYVDNGRGNYANPSDKEDLLTPGWRTPIWFEHYVSLFTDPKVREPLLAVFTWTVAFSVITVITQFALGLLLALALDKNIRGRRFYRIVAILPYAMPSIMSILIWAGMFDSEFGAINALLGTHIAWFQDANFARAAVLVVNLWLGFPYFYLVSSGSLQAIPTELGEAASIDGANSRQIFRGITLPILLRMLTPLLISSFAFNFNNFNLIFLLTGGGPRNDLEGEIAGATDILISYTYKIAFGSDIQNLGLASAISVVIFFIVASISLYGIRKSKVLDEFA